MSRSDSRPEPRLRLFIPPGRWPRPPRPPRRVSQVPPLICLRAPSPTTPRGPAVAFAHCFPTGGRLHPSWETGHLPFTLTRPNRVHWRYGSRIRRSRLRRWNCFHPRSIGYLLNEHLQGKLLSACKISQASPGTPRLKSCPDTDRALIDFFHTFQGRGLKKVEQMSRTSHLLHVRGRLRDAPKHRSVNNLPAGSRSCFPSLQSRDRRYIVPRLQVVAVACPQAFQSLMVTSVCINYILTIQSTILG